MTTSLLAQQQDSIIMIGVKEAPPFVTKDAGSYTGVSIDSWEMVNETLGYRYEYIEYGTIEELIQGVSSGEVDMSINPLTVTEQRMSTMDFSQPYFISKTVAVKELESTLLSFIQNLFSWKFYSAVLGLISVIAFFGFLIWIFEHRKNPEEFGGRFKGIGQGFWWSAVTMTTVGYGDKAPRTFGGRFVAFIWMFAAIVLISGLTASIASSLTVKTINEKIDTMQDLKRFEVVTVDQSSASELLQQYGVDHRKKATLDAAIEDLVQGGTRLLVYDKPILLYQLQQRGLSEDYVVIDRDFKTDYYSYSFPRGSQLLNKIEPSIIRILKTPEWNMKISKYE